MYTGVSLNKLSSSIIAFSNIIGDVSKQLILSNTFLKRDWIYCSQQGADQAGNLLLYVGQSQHAYSVDLLGDISGETFV